MFLYRFNRFRTGSAADILIPSTRRARDSPTSAVNYFPQAPVYRIEWRANFAMFISTEDHAPWHERYDTRPSRHLLSSIERSAFTFRSSSSRLSPRQVARGESVVRRHRDNDS